MQDYTSNLLKEIGKSYFITALLPTMMFILVASVLFVRLIPLEISKSLQDETAPMGGLTVFYITIILCLAFTIYSIQQFITNFVSGDYFPQWYKNILLEKNKKKIQNGVAFFNSELKFYEKIKADNDFIQSQEIYQRAQEYLIKMQDVAPIEYAYFEPTRLKNIWKAIEYFPRKKYGISGYEIWERIRFLVPERVLDEYEEKNNLSKFTMNSCFYAFLIGIISLLISIAYIIYFSVYLLITLFFYFLIIEKGLIFLPTYFSFFIVNFSEEATLFNIGFYFFVCLGAFVLTYLFYLSTIPAAKEVAGVIYAAIENYRFKIIDVYNLPKLNGILSHEISETEFWDRLRYPLKNTQNIRMSTIDYDLEKFITITKNTEEE